MWLTHAAYWKHRLLPGILYSFGSLYFNIGVNLTKTVIVFKAKFLQRLVSKASELKVAAWT